MIVRDVVNIGEKGLKFYSLLFLRLSIISFVSLSVLFSLYQALLVGVWEAITNGLTFGLNVTIVAVSLLFIFDISMRLRIYLIYKRIDFGLIQRRKIIVDGPAGEIHGLMKLVLDSTGIIKSLKVLKLRNGFEAVTLSSIRSVGEIIEISILNEGNGLTCITIVSKPKTSFNLLDFGKNFENVEMLLFKMLELK